MKVLNAGYVRLLEHMGGDKAVVRNARRCWRSEDKSNEQSDRNLIRHLLREGHMTPFEAMVFTFDVKCPIFVARQWMRHRIGSYNEESLRYCIAEGDYYIPSGLGPGMDWSWKVCNDAQLSAYKYYLNQGLPKEQARALLPIGIYTKFYWTVNGSSLMNFLRLRLDEAAQYEIRQYAQAILEQVTRVAPVSFTAFKELILTGEVIKIESHSD